jgi:vacuolar-type H+-ATPase subunit C/Vma6
LFRRRPFSIDTAFCFIKLKQFEEDVLTSVAEGLGMGMSGEDIFAVLEVEP